MIPFEAIYVATPALTAQAPILVIAGPLIGACAAGNRRAYIICRGLLASEVMLLTALARLASQTKVA